MPSRTIRDDKMAVTGKSGSSASASTRIGTKSTVSGASPQSKKSKVDDSSKKKNKNDAEGPPKPVNKPPRHSADATNNSPETSTTSPGKKSKKVVVARTQSGSAATEKKPKSPMKRAKSSSDSGQNLSTNIEPEKRKPMNDPGDLKPPARTARSAVQENVAPGGDQKTSIASSKVASRAAIPASPSKARASVPEDLKTQKVHHDDSGKKKTSGDTAKSSNKNNTAPAEPGAYLVQGSNVERTQTGVLSPQNASSPPVSPSKRTKVQTSSAPNSKATEQAPSRARKPLVVAAELSTDLEANIEDEVRRRILSETATAHVVSVAHGIPMLDPKEEARRLADLRELHKPRGVKEKIFGDSRNANVDIATSPESIRKRNYLKWIVKRHQASNLWVATVQTKQKAVEQHDVIEVERTSVNFSATTQQEAFETGLANAVPMMQPMEEFPICYVCKAKFALLRRPQHCKNCGVCVCSSCTTQWPGKMFPETYGAKTLNNVCTACDWLASSFRDALVDGNFKTALHLHAAGNVNIRTPFCLDKKAEIMHPIHLAVLGGNVRIVRWLIRERFCSVKVPGKPTRGKKQDTEVPLLTSKGRSPLSIAMLHQKLDVVRFLVVEGGASLFDEKELGLGLALANFTTVLKMLPDNFFDGKLVQPTSVPSSVGQSSLGTDSS